MFVLFQPRRYVSWANCSSHNIKTKHFRCLNWFSSVSMTVMANMTVWVITRPQTENVINYLLRHITFLRYFDCGEKITIVFRRMSPTCTSFHPPVCKPTLPIVFVFLPRECFGLEQESQIQTKFDFGKKFTRHLGTDTELNSRCQTQLIFYQSSHHLTQQKI